MHEEEKPISDILYNKGRYERGMGPTQEEEIEEPEFEPADGEDDDEW